MIIQLNVAFDCDFIFLFVAGVVEMESDKGPVSQPSQDSSEADHSHFEADAIEPMVVLPVEGAAALGAVGNGNPLEAMMAAGFPPGMDIPPDADDETMVELAIALSLQVMNIF